MANKIKNLSSEDQKTATLVLDSIRYLQERMGELVIIDKLAKKANLGDNELKEILIKLEDNGEIDIPKKGFVILKKIEKVRIRDLRSKHLDKVIEIRGKVKQQSDIRPQIVSAKFECPNCGAIIQVLQVEKIFRNPSICTCGCSESFKVLSKELSDVMRIIVSELKEDTNKEESPNHSREIQVFLGDELTTPEKEELCKPGSKVTITGKLTEIPVYSEHGLSTRLDWGITADSLEALK